MHLQLLLFIVNKNFEGFFILFFTFEVEVFIILFLPTSLVKPAEILHLTTLE